MQPSTHLLHDSIHSSAVWALADLLAPLHSLFEQGSAHQSAKSGVSHFPQYHSSLIDGKQNSRECLANALPDIHCVLEVPQVVHWLLKMDVAELPSAVLQLFPVVFERHNGKKP